MDNTILKAKVINSGAQVFKSKLRLFIIAFIVLFFLLNSFGTVGVGERGIKTRFSALAGGAIKEGLYFKIPLIESVTTMDIKIQKEQVDADAASKDLQTVHTTVAANFHVDPERVTNIY